MRAKLLLVTICLIVILSGCSNYKELNELAIVLGVGIDYIPDKNIYEVTYQVVKPSENAAKGTGSDSTPVINYEATGKTLNEAAGNSANFFSRQNIYSHIQLVIIGERLAKKESLNFIFDIFERDAGVRVNVPVLIARGTGVKTTMDMLSTVDKIPVQALSGKVKNASETLGEHGQTKIYEVIEDLTSEGSEPAISGVSVIGSKKVGARKENLETMEKTFTKLNGVSIFREGKLVGWMDGKKTKSLQIIDNKLKNTNLRFHCDEKRYNDLTINQLKNDTKVDIQNNQAIITVNTKAYGYIVELLCNKDISKRQIIKEYEEKAEKELKKEITDGILAAQKLKSDVFGFGEILHATQPKKWKESRRQWDHFFSQAKVNVKVNVSIEETGMRIKPYPY
ncbi:Ger(x)C family spore germination protein [Neobacillus cucumis]|uniref:Ger(x)C family spore germination protein n=1 Tax=Neobacillus cucumis TaxID=1740721 RepID=UPI002E24A5E7|nr:Ger(x)C family spore germination protein [Neobacillus cucumis]